MSNNIKIDLGGMKVFVSGIDLIYDPASTSDPTRAAAMRHVPVTLVNNAASNTSKSLVVTTENMTLTPGASQVFVLTIPGVQATDKAHVAVVGGSNTRPNFTLSAETAKNTVNVTLKNTDTIDSLNGNIEFKLKVHTPTTTTATTPVA